MFVQLRIALQIRPKTHDIQICNRELIRWQLPLKSIAITVISCTRSHLKSIIFNLEHQNNPSNTNPESYSVKYCQWLCIIRKANFHPLLKTQLPYQTKQHSTLSTRLVSDETNLSFNTPSMYS
ncbi:hypothetical protein NPIL_137871 [Nephila pilipes]|uniref:Uncharacterized protein n=1 Tax=Nephila pilipes TaxID=299642 RepID=A0A8X6QT12_NEPPI|nr:hypothetical protein NPIL_137871 [Nephila pilipes]